MFLNFFDSALGVFLYLKIDEYIVCRVSQIVVGRAEFIDGVDLADKKRDGGYAGRDLPSQNALRP